jgi:hypothetical protein
VLYAPGSDCDTTALFETGKCKRFAAVTKAATRKSAQLDAGRHWNALNHNAGSPKKVINIRRLFSDSVTLARVSGSQSPNLKHRARALRQGCRQTPEAARAWAHHRPTERRRAAVGPLTERAS